jgi:hypothetical protein
MRSSILISASGADSMRQRASATTHPLRKFDLQKGGKIPGKTASKREKKILKKLGKILKKHVDKPKIMW